MEARTQIAYGAPTHLVGKCCLQFMFMVVAMCELLGMSANVPTDIRFSFAALAKRGGETGPHKDGWGIAFYEGKGCRTFHDPSPSAQSEIARFVCGLPIKSQVVIAHVRKANRGKVALENTHPFSRVLWGEIWTFAHNGQLKGIKQKPLSHYQPVGTTDSEHAFCWMLDQMRIHFPKRPTAHQLRRLIETLTAQLRQLGPFNALLSNGDTVYASCSKKLCYIQRQAPFGKASLIDEDMQVDFNKETTPNDKVVIIATRPLTHDEQWTQIPEDSLIVFKNGTLI